MPYWMGFDSEAGRGWLRLTGREGGKLGDVVYIHDSYKIEWERVLRSHDGQGYYRNIPRTQARITAWMSELHSKQMITPGVGLSHRVIVLNTITTQSRSTAQMVGQRYM